MSSGLSSRASYRTAQQPSERTRNRGGVFLNPQLQRRRFSPRERALTFGGQPSGVSGRRGETESGGERLRRAGHHTYTVNVSGWELPPPGRTSEVFVVALADTKTGGVSGRSGGSVSAPRPPPLCSPRPASCRCPGPAGYCTPAPESDVPADHNRPDTLRLP